MEAMSSPDRVLPSDILMNQTPISQTSEEFARLEYFLQLSLQSTSCRVDKIWAIANPHLTRQFEDRTAGLLIHDSWVDVARLGYDNGIQELCIRGFKVPTQGLPFTVGSVTTQDFAPGGKRRFRFILCKIGVGRPYRINRSVFATGQPPALPQGFDSFYLAPEDGAADMLQSQTASLGKYRHQFLITDSCLALPCYLVDFEFDPDNEMRRKRLVCDVCEEQPATLLCRQDNAKLCPRCDEELHSANKIVARHQRVPLTEQQGFGLCQWHNLPVEFYDPLARQPVCVHCKMIGSHATGINASHPLIQISAAYNDAIAASQVEDPLLKVRQQALQNQLVVVDERLTAVKKNAADVEEALYRLLQEALQVLQIQSDKKINILGAVQVELHRQLEHVSWAESFLKYQRELLSPLDFLRAWERHIIFRADVHGMKDMREQIDVEPDLEAEGRVQVTSRAERQARSILPPFYGSPDVAHDPYQMQQQQQQQQQPTQPYQPQPTQQPFQQQGQPLAGSADGVPPPPTPTQTETTAAFRSGVLGVPQQSRGAFASAGSAGWRNSQGAPQQFGSTGMGAAATTTAAVGLGSQFPPTPSQPMFSQPPMTPVMSARSGSFNIGGAGSMLGSDNVQPQPYYGGSQFAEGSAPPGDGAETALHSTTAFWVETLRKRRKEKLLREKYDELAKLLVDPDLTVTVALCDSTAQADSDDVARALVDVFEPVNRTLDLMQKLIVRDMGGTDAVALILRQATFMTKALHVYSALVGSQYLRLLLGPIIHFICESPMSFEVDPDRLTPDQDLKANMRNLTNTSQMFMEKIMQSLNNIPVQLRLLCGYVAQAAKDRFPTQPTAFNSAVAGYFFLRFICPAIVLPYELKVTDFVPSETVRRNLTLIAKVLQKLASGVTFKKELYLLDLNPYIMANTDNVSHFLQRLANTSALPAPWQIPAVPISPEARQDALVVLHRHVAVNIEAIGIAAQRPADPTNMELANSQMGVLVNLLTALGPAPVEKPQSYVPTIEVPNAQQFL